MIDVAINANVIGTSPGYRQAGVSTYVTQLLRHFWQSPRADGVRWTVFAPRGVTHEVIAAPPEVRICHPLLPTDRPVPRIAWEQVVAPTRFAAARPDVFFCPLNVVPLAAPCPTVVSVMDLAYARFSLHRPLKNTYLRAMTAASVRRASHVVTISEFTRREVLDVFGANPASVTAVPLAHDPRFRPQDDAAIAAVRAKYDLPPRFLLSVGTLEPRKNLPTLLRAFALVRDRLAMPLVLVGGKGWGHQPLVELLVSLGLRDHVRLAGFMPAEDLPQYYAAATAFVYPSLYEGFGLPPLEAMGVGTPVVTSNAASLREVGGEAVLSVPAMDVAALADALVRACRDEELRRTLRCRGLARAATFSWQTTADSTVRIILAAAGRVPSGRTCLAARPAADAARQRPRPIRVLYIGHTAALGGAEIALYQLLKALDRRQVAPRVILFSSGSLVERIRSLGIDVTVLPLPRTVVDARKDGLGLGTLTRIDDLAACLAAVTRLSGMILSSGAQVVHTNTLKAHVLGGLAARLAGRPLVWHVRERLADDYLPPPVVSALRRLAQTLPDRIVANSQATFAAVLDAGAARRSDELARRCVVAYDGINLGQFNQAAAADAGGFTTIGMVGRISPFKGQDVFLRAAARLLASRPHLRFVIVGAALFGEDAYARTIERLAGSLGIDHAVEFRGFRENVAEEMARMDVVVHASVWPEPFGQVIIEAMASGKPLVATNGGGVPEIVDHGITGLLVPMGDDAAMAAAIAELVAHPAAARRMGRSASDHVRSKFSIDVTSSRVVGIYRELAEPVATAAGGGVRGRKVPGIPVVTPTATAPAP